MLISDANITQADLAVRLRLVIARTARRLRQEAGEELSPSQAAALATIDRHGPLTPSELAIRERIQRPTATPRHRAPGGGGPRRPHAPIPTTGARAWSGLTPEGRAAARARAHAQGRLPRRAACATSTPTSARRSTVPPPSSSACSRGTARDGRPAPRRHLAGRSQLPPLLRRPDRLGLGNWMQTVAEMWLIVQLTGSGAAVGFTAGAAVRADPALRRLGRPDRRSPAQAPRADGHPGAHGAAGADAVRA